MPFVRSHVERSAEAVAQGFVVSPERKRVAEFLSGGGVDQFERAILGVVVELLQDPGFDLGAPVGEGDFVEIVLDNGLSFRGSLFVDCLWREGCGYGGWSEGRWCGCRLRLHG